MARVFSLLVIPQGSSRRWPLGFTVGQVAEVPFVLS
jgi:hypothetical protein